MHIIQPGLKKVTCHICDLSITSRHHGSTQIIIIIIYLFIKHTNKTDTHWRQKTRPWNMATRYTQYANCWPT